MERKTVALAINEITGNFLLPMYRKIRREVLNRGHNLIIFEGRILDSPVHGEKQQNVIYKWLNIDIVNGVLVTSSTLFHFNNAPTNQAFFDAISDKPVVSFNVEFPGIPCVMVDNHTGITELVTHLIKFHGCNRIAFVSGPESNQEANQRLDAYISTLTHYSKPVESSLIIQGDLRPEGGIAAAQALINGDVICDAVVFANDDMALTAVRYLNTFKPELLERLSITGFDDIPNARLSVPQLTTCRQPIYSMAETAVNLITNSMNGEQVPLITKEKTELKIRQTCGCFHVDSESNDEFLAEQFLHKLYEKMQTFHVESIYEELSSALNMYSVDNFFIVLFDKYEQVSIEQAIPEKGRLVFSMSQGEMTVSKNPEFIETRSILPSKLLFRDDPVAWLFKPLCFEQECFGYIVLEAKEQMEGFYEAVHLHLCMILRGAIQNGETFWETP